MSSVIAACGVVVLYLAGGFLLVRYEERQRRKAIAHMDAAIARMKAKTPSAND